MSASIFNADTVKILKDKLQFKSGGKINSQGSVDPTAVATDGSVGDIYINTNTGLVYTKLIAGLNTDWAKNITSAVDQVLNSPIISNVVPPAPQTGNLWMTDTLNVKLADSTLQVGQEMYVASINLTGAPIANGTLVYQTGVFSGLYSQIAKAQANAEATHKVIGMTTNTVNHNASANVTTYGLVRDINTVNDSEGNALAAGDILYLSATVAGGYTKNVPLNSYYVIEIGYVANAAVSGSIFININHDHARDLSLVTKEPTGFDVPANVTVTYDPATRKITLGGSFTVYWRGSVVTAIQPGHVSAAHPATLDKVYYYYFDGTNLVWSEIQWTFDMVMIAIVQYGTTNKFALRECHGLMDWNSHQEFHRVIGTYRSSGGTLSNYTTGSTTATNKRPDISDCTIYDEDVPTINAALTSKLYTKIFLTGTTATPVVNFTVETAEIVPMNTGITIPAYNLLTGGNWTQAAMTNNTYQAIWIIAMPMTASAGSQQYRFLWMQGQSISGTLANIQALTPADLTLGNLSALSPEFVFITKIIIQYVAGGTNNWNIVSVQNLTGNKFVQTSSAAGVYLSSVAHDASLSGDGSVSSPLATAYVPAVAANWDVGVDPVTPNDALDKIASQGVVKVQNMNKVFAGPTSGADALATFRALVDADFATNLISLSKLINATAQGNFIARKSASAGAWEDCTVQQASNLLMPLNTYTTNQTLSATNMIVLGNHASTAFTITLPAVSGNSGLRYKIKNINDALVTVDANGSELIDDDLTIVLSRGDAIEIITNGAAWFKL